MNNIMDLNHARLKKQVREDLANDRTPLYLSYNKGRVLTGEQILKPKDDFADGLVRVRQSLERINDLMSELKKLNNSTKVSDNNTDK
jgi:hypothetical protein